MQLISNKKTQIPDKKKYILFSELHSLLSAGLSFSKSLELLISGEKRSHEAAVLNQIYTQLLNGMEFWRSIKLSGSFSELDSGVIRIGEEVGKMDQSLLFLSDYYRKKNEQRNILLGALSYPLIIIFIAMLVLFFMLMVVIPMFEQVYSRMGGELPEITRFMMYLSSQFPIICFASVSVIIGLVVLRMLYGNTIRYRKLSSTFILHIPFIGNLVRAHYQAQFCKLLYLLISSDVSLLQSFDMLRTIIRFYPYAQSFEVMSRGLKRGDTFSEGLEEFQDIYGSKLIALVRVGEETNCLDKMFLNLSSDITLELENKLKRLGTVLEPVLILCIGTIVAFVLIAMYMPMFKLGQTIA